MPEIFARLGSSGAVGYRSVMLPEGTTWLDLVTLTIAVVSGIVAVVGAFLAIRSDRRESKLGVRVDVARVPNFPLVAIVMTNTERRTVTIQRARLLASRASDATDFERWQDVNVRRSPSGIPLSDPALPKTLEPASPSYAVVAGASTIKSAFYPALPAWAEGEDTLGNRYWGEVPPDVQAAIKATKRQVPGPVDDYNMPTWVEIEDDVAEPSAESR
jgi:hypothetical protein